MRWHRRTLLLEACRSGAAVLVLGLVALMTPLLSVWQLLLLPLCLLFATHLYNCITRWVSDVTVDEDGICISRGWLPALNVRWDELLSLEVRLFSLGRYRKAAMSDIKLRSADAVLLIDDGVEGFSDIVARAWREAKQRGTSVSDTTRANLFAMGHSDAGHS